MWALKSLKHTDSEVTNHGIAQVEQKAVFSPGRVLRACQHLGTKAGSAGARDRSAMLARATVTGKGQQRWVPPRELAMGAGTSGDPGVQVGCYYVLKSVSSQLAGASWQKGTNITPSFYAQTRPLFLPAETVVSEKSGVCSFPCLPKGMGGSLPLLFRLQGSGAAAATQYCPSISETSPTHQRLH